MVSKPTISNFNRELSSWNTELVQSREHKDPISLAIGIAVQANARSNVLSSRAMPDIRDRSSRRSRSRGRHAHRGTARPKVDRRVLLVGRIRELAIYRAEVLEEHGLKVAIQTDVDAATEVIAHGEFDIAILSYTLPSDAVERLADLIRSACPGCPIITISEKAWVDKRINPDAIAIADEGSEGLIKAIRQVLSDKS